MLHINNLAAKTHTQSNILNKFIAIFVMSGFAATMAQPFTNQAFQAQAATFDERCGAEGVALCVGFNSAADVNDYVYGNDLGEILGTVDTEIKASGDGSLKFVIPSMTSENSSGAYDRVFDITNTGYGPGSTFYVQFKQRFSETMLNSAMGGNGWEQLVLTSQFGSYGDPINVGLYNLDYTNKPTLTQNGLVYEQTPVDDTPVEYVANEWMTFAIKVTVGTWSEEESQIQVWAARENENLEEIYNITASIPLNPIDPDSGFNKITFGPHNTGKLDTTSHSIATTWYDELIVSIQPIADPVPYIDRIAPSTSTITAVVEATSVNLTWTEATDNVGVTGYKLYRDAIEIADQATMVFTDTGLTRGTTYTYTVKAYDAAGNTSELSAVATAVIEPEVVEPTPTPTPTPPPSSGGGNGGGKGGGSNKPDKPKNPRHERTTLVEDAGTIYFLGETYRYPFATAESFLSWGVKFEDVIEANDGDLAMPIGPIAGYKISDEPRHPRATLIEHEGTIYFLGESVRYPFPSLRIFNSWGATLDSVVPANSGDVAMPIGEIVKLKK